MRLSGIAITALVSLLPSLCLTQDPIRPYPVPDSYLKSTSFLDHESYVSGFDDPQWYLDNIPFVDFPEQSIQDVYYYRTSVIKRHLKYAHEGQGWVFTEFIHVSSKSFNLTSVPVLTLCSLLLGLQNCNRSLTQWDTTWWKDVGCEIRIM